MTAFAILVKVSVPDSKSLAQFDACGSNIIGIYVTSWEQGLCKHSQESLILYLTKLP